MGWDEFGYQFDECMDNDMVVLFVSCDEGCNMYLVKHKDWIRSWNQTHNIFKYCCNSLSETLEGDGGGVHQVRPSVNPPYVFFFSSLQFFLKR